ncbi:M24 family metallopeptidase [Nocardia sp. NPDC004711]
MRIAGRIVERVMSKALEMIEPGVRQCDVVAEIYAAQIRGLEDAGGDYTAPPPLLPTGATAASPHFTWSDAPFGVGEATALELGGCYQRYHAPLSRTIFLGEAPPRYAEMADIVGEGMAAALGAVRPGVRCKEIEAAWGQALAARGPDWAGRRGSGRIGYSMGLNYPPTWSERTISLRAGDTTILEPNMTFHMILTLSIDGLGYEESESFIVTEHGAEFLSKIPRGLTVKR